MIHAQLNNEHSTKYNTLNILLMTVWNVDKQLRFKLICSGLLILISSLLNIIIPWLLKFIVDSFYNPSMTKLLFWVFISYGVLWTISQATINLRQILVYRSFDVRYPKFNQKLVIYKFF